MKWQVNMISTWKKVVVWMNLNLPHTFLPLFIKLFLTTALPNLPMTSIRMLFVLRQNYVTCKSTKTELIQVSNFIIVLYSQQTNQQIFLFTVNGSMQQHFGGGGNFVSISANGTQSLHDGSVNGGSVISRSHSTGHNSNSSASGGGGVALFQHNPTAFQHTGGGGNQRHSFMLHPTQFMDGSYGHSSQESVFQSPVPQQQPVLQVQPATKGSKKRKKSNESGQVPAVQLEWQYRKNGLTQAQHWVATTRSVVKPFFPVDPLNKWALKCNFCECRLLNPDKDTGTRSLRLHASGKGKDHFLVLLGFGLDLLRLGRLRTTVLPFS